MADASGVGQALAYVCAGIIYPNGLAQPSATGRKTVVRRGWLLPSDLFTAQNIRNGTDFVTVTISSQERHKAAEPLGRPWRSGERITPTVEVGLQGEGVVVSIPSGMTPAGVVGVWQQAAGLSTCAAYAAQPTDTAETIASGLGIVISGSVVQGNMVSLPGTQLAARVVGYGQSVRVVRRQEQRYRISVWTADATVRETLGACLDDGLSGISWLTTLDGNQAQVGFRGVVDVDTMQDQALYRRDYFFELVFDTIQVEWAPGMLSGGGTMSGNGLSVPFGFQGEEIAQKSAREALDAMNAVILARRGAGQYPGFGVDSYGTVVATD